MSLFRDIDGLLRGKYTTPEGLHGGRVDIPVSKLAKAGLILGAIYGVFMGLFALTRQDPSIPQFIATACKVPLLFFLTLVVTFPSLYVFSALARSKLPISHTARLLMAAITVNLALLASFGPVIGFFTLSTDSYVFMKLLNICFFGISGVVGLIFLRRILFHVFSNSGDVQDPEGLAESSHLNSEAGRARAIFGTWMLLFAAVGAQMGWILRPFIGNPTMEFELFRARESSFFEELIRALGQFL